MSTETTPSVTVDARGYRCPLPVIRLQSTLNKLPEGAQVTVFADDPIAAVDIPHFCGEGGHDYQRLPDQAEACVFLVTRGGKSG